MHAIHPEFQQVYRTRALRRLFIWYFMTTVQVLIFLSCLILSFYEMYWDRTSFLGMGVAIINGVLRIGGMVLVYPYWRGTRQFAVDGSRRPMVFWHRLLTWEEGREERLRKRENHRRHQRRLRRETRRRERQERRQRMMQQQQQTATATSDAPQEQPQPQPSTSTGSAIPPFPAETLI